MEEKKKQISDHDRIEQQKKLEKKVKKVDKFLNEGRKRWLKIINKTVQIFLLWVIGMFIIHLPLLSYYATGTFTDFQGMADYLWRENELINETMEYHIKLGLFLIIPGIIAAILWNMDLWRKFYYYDILTISGIKGVHIKKMNDEFIVFKRNIGEPVSIKSVEGGISEVCQFIGKQSAHVEEFGRDGFKMIFKDGLPKIEDNIPMKKPEEVFKENSLYLGVRDKKGKAIAYTKDSEVRGKFNGHMLVIGASGSGKSHSMNTIMLNWINPETYGELEKIYILNFKDSADYNPYEGLDKVEYCGNNIRNALKMCKEVELEMMKRYIYNKIHSKENYPGQKLLFIVDEIQTIAEEQGSKGGSRVDKNSWAELDSIFKKLASKARAANISLIVILQKGTADNLPGGTTFRDNLRHRFALKNNNMNLLMDADEIDRYKIEADKLKAGQFVYYDNLGDGIQDGFTLSLDYKFNTEELNKLQDKPEDIKTTKKLVKYEKVAFKAMELARLDSEKAEAEGRKTHIDTLEQLKDFEERDYIKEAMEFYGITDWGEDDWENEEIIEVEVEEPKLEPKIPEELIQQIEEEPEEIDEIEKKRLEREEQERKERMAKFDFDPRVIMKKAKEKKESIQEEETKIELPKVEKTEQKMELPKYNFDSATKEEPGEIKQAESLDEEEIKRRLAKLDKLN